MADEEHLARLKQGSAAWNQWWEAYPKIEPNLCLADLSEANLAEANLGGQSSSGRSSSRRTLPGRTLPGMTLTRANLTVAYTALTIFGDVDLSIVLGLETAQHHRPSTIGIDTLYRSHDNI